MSLNIWNILLMSWKMMKILLFEIEKYFLDDVLDKNNYLIIQEIKKKVKNRSFKTIKKIINE